MTNHVQPAQAQAPGIPAAHAPHAPQAPQVPEVMYHVCFGAHPECSGVNPDPACQEILHTVATRQGLMGVFAAMGMPQAEIQQAVEYAMPHYEQGYAAGMARLHEGMRLDPYLRSQLHVSALRAQPAPAPPTAQTSAQNVAAAQRVAPAQVPQAPQAPGPQAMPAPEAQPAVLGSIFDAARQEPAPNGGKLAAPTQPAPPEPRSEPQVEQAAASVAKLRPMARPMTAEEIATAGHILPDLPEDEANGA